MLRFVCAYDEEGRSIGAAFLHSTSAAHEALKMGYLLDAINWHGTAEIESCVPPPEVAIPAIGRLLTDAEIDAIGTLIGKGDSHADAESTRKGPQQAAERQASEPTVH